MAENKKVTEINDSPAKKSLKKPIIIACVALVVIGAVIAVVLLNGKGPLSGSYQSENTFAGVMEFSGKNKVKVITLLYTAEGTYSLDGEKLVLHLSALGRNNDPEGTATLLDDGTYYIHINGSDFYHEDHKQ